MDGTRLSREAVLRSAQLSIFTLAGGVASNEEARISWCAQIDKLISNELMLSAETASSAEGLCVLCRALALLARRAIIIPQKRSIAEYVCLLSVHCFELYSGDI